ncbi:E3 ubiquitin-protein ligase BIG BROTHER [Nymphaea colorata]|nr:E3 ubiquitin-protein ligase BIG BROTHER [Nymphaea colorata]XP_031488147.1 E3 ubiquitin-protein ligase BIG BROTHER [Nymphaea colorata]XP_031488148.1 E3 ubiquitin-protein ligase BIG BROTHER [Nymphaea colorata]
MNGQRQLELHYIDTGFPYTVTESFMDLFEGLSYTHSDFGVAETSHNEGNSYWSLYVDPNKPGLPGHSSNTFYTHGYMSGMNDYGMRSDESRRTWGNYSVANYDEPLAFLMHGNGSSELTSTNGLAHIEECNRVNHVASSSQAVWEDNIDPDNMTYEELLDLGEAVGTQSKGLPKEIISTLPISKYKCSIFSRKRTRERCVICQMNYRRGDMCMTLPCKHIYHSGCVSRWLSINKACPVCFVEVSGTGRKQ